MAAVGSRAAAARQEPGPPPPARPAARWPGEPGEVTGAGALARSPSATRVLAQPGAGVAVMGALAAVRIVRRRASIPPQQRQGAESRLATGHEEAAGGLRRARDLGVTGEVTDPATTRVAIARASAAAPQARGQHGNIPL